MVARVLSDAGLWLGPRERLMPAQADNADGFYENLDLVRLADDILDHLGGAWDCPPPIAADADQFSAELLGPLGERAERCLAALADGAPGPLSGWKDPRATLLLPLWHRLAPGLRVVACLREPLAVASSLRRRNHVSLRHGVALWKAYNAALLRWAETGSLVVTHYDAWLAQPQAELRRVAEALGLRPDEGRTEAAMQAVRGTAQSAAQVQQGCDALWALGGGEAMGTYDHLRALAGPVYAATPSGQRPADPAGAAPGCAAPGARDAQMLALQRRVGELGDELARLRAAAAPYRVGTPIDARKGGNAPLYLRKGWARPEEAGTWMLGTRAELHLPLHALAEGSALELQARVRPMLAPGQPPLTVTLHANGQLTGTWQLAEARSATLASTLAAPLLTAEHPLRIALGVDRACAPSAVGLSRDQRPLGLLLGSLVLRAVKQG